jgi:hypothetical protein
MNVNASKWLASTSGRQPYTQRNVNLPIDLESPPANFDNVLQRIVTPREDWAKCRDVHPTP